jgi:hypothetical protein
LVFFRELLLAGNVWTLRTVENLLFGHLHLLPRRTGLFYVVDEMRPWSRSPTKHLRHLVRCLCVCRHHMPSQASLLRAKCLSPHLQRLVLSLLNFRNRCSA